MPVQKTENVPQIIIRWIIRVKPGQIYALWYVIQRRKSLECKHISKNAGMTNDATGFYRPL